MVEYNIPLEIKQHYFYLDGKWKNSKDSMELVSDNGIIMLNYNAKQVNIVASNSAELQIFVDEAPVPDNMMGSDLTSQNKILVSEPRLDNIINSDYSESHELIISIKGSEFEIFTFTFG